MVVTFVRVYYSLVGGHVVWLITAVFVCQSQQRNVLRQLLGLIPVKEEDIFCNLAESLKP